MSDLAQPQKNNATCQQGQAAFEDVTCRTNAAVANAAPVLRHRDAEAAWHAISS